MNTARIAAALNTISLAFGELAEALNEQPEPERAVAMAASEPATTAPAAAPARAATPPGGSASEPSPFEDETATWEPPDTLPTQDEGSEAICPKHRVPFTAGQYGPFCKQATDDPAWGKQKGDRLWCRITPKNAAEYLRIKAAA